MADTAQWMQILEQRLGSQRLEVERVEQTLNVKAGRGPTAAKANIDPSRLWQLLEDRQPGEHERLIAGYASGVKHVLMEPKRSKASEWDYVESAGRLFPNLEVHTFVLGAEDAGGEAPWTREFHEDLVVAYLMDLDIGMRVLTEAQVERWQASAERVTAAARSMLFHRSRNMKPKKLDDFDGVEKIHVGDGYDAMRSIVIADIFFSEFDDSFRFSTPTQDALLFVREDDDTRLDQLRKATDAHFDAADYPLSRSVYGFEVGRPVLDERRT